MDKFTWWRKQHYPSVQLISDGSTHNDNKMGAVATLHFALKQLGIDESVMVIAG